MHSALVQQGVVSQGKFTRQLNRSDVWLTDSFDVPKIRHIGTGVNAWAAYFYDFNFYSKLAAAKSSRNEMTMLSQKTLGERLLREKCARRSPAHLKISSEPVSKDSWRLTPPRNILNEGHFG
jgi:hypothetical protein